MDFQPVKRELVGSDRPTGTQVAISHEAMGRLVTEACAALFAVDEPRDVLHVLAQLLPRAVPFDRLAVFEADWSRLELRPRVLLGRDQAEIRERTFPIGAGITGRAFLRGEPQNCGDTSTVPSAAGAPLGVAGRGTGESLLAVPLASGARRLGVLDVWREGRDQFSYRDVERCSLLADLAADAWRRADERLRLEHQVVVDAATGLLNRRWWDTLAEREAAQSRRSGSPIGILCVDLDDFRVVNEAVGHATADMILRRVGRVLQSETGAGDAVVRFGEDDYVVVLRDRDESGAAEVADELLASLRSTVGLSAPGITASVGVATFPDHGHSLDEVLGAAASALRAAKALGKDRSVRYSEVAGGARPPADVEPTPTPSAAVAHLPPGQRRMLADLEEEHRRLAEAQRIAMIGSFEIDLASGAVEWSAELRRILGVPVDEVPSAAGVMDRLHAEDLERYARSMSEWTQGMSGIMEDTFRVVRDDGEIRHLHVRLRARTREDDHRVVSGTFQDVTDRLTSEEARRVAEEHFSLAFEQGTVGMLTASLDRVITRVNGALCEMLGRPPEEILGHLPDEFADAPDRAAMLGSPLVPRLLAAPGGRLDLERRWLRPDGSAVDTSCHLSLVRDAAGAPQYLFAQIEDVTARRQQDEEIRRLALEDPLTGLPNRQLLHDRIEQSLRQAAQSGTGLAVLLVDVDFFKRVNDSLGRGAGDRLLAQVARRLDADLAPDDTVARLSGDEFVLLHRGVEDVEQARAACLRLHALLAPPFSVGGEEMYLTASCGVALASGDETPEDLLRDAEAAMYQAKARGGGQSVVFEEAIRRDASRRHTMEAQLRRAVERRELGVQFQPIVRLADEAVVGFEALARWTDHDGRRIPPAEFVPMAEDLGLIGQLGECVLDVALEQLAAWRAEVPGWEALFAAVNISPRQLVAADLRARCRAVLARHRLPPRALRLEVTESTLMDDPELSSRILRELTDDGIAIAMDDFGTGYSSLSRLKQLPVSTLKIDRSFVDGIGTDPSDTSIVRAIVALGRALGLELCAEGVELPLQRDELHDLGCELAQGFLWARPMDAADLTRSFAPAGARRGALSPS